MYLVCELVVKKASPRVAISNMPSDTMNEGNPIFTLTAPRCAPDQAADDNACRQAQASQRQMHIDHQHPDDRAA